MTEMVGGNSMLFAASPHRRTIRRRTSGAADRYIAKHEVIEAALGTLHRQFIDTNCGAGTERWWRLLVWPTA